MLCSEVMSRKHAGLDGNLRSAPGGHRGEPRSAGAKPLTRTAGLPGGQHQAARRPATPVVRQVGEHFQLIAGERRFRAVSPRACSPFPSMS